jgi:glycosyltransferase involved in cell wall biosynthesis
VIREYVRLTAPLDLEADADPLPGTRLQHKFRSFWGVEDHWVRSLRSAVRRIKPDAVIVGGLDALPYFPALEGTIRVWYAADEWVLHHLSMLQFRRGHFAENLKGAAMKGLYERAHRHVMDRVWVVTERDRRAMQRIAGVRNVDVLPNGVDADFFKPGPEAVEPKTAVFWGRLDFGPNIQALEWFCRQVWPKVRELAPDARFTIIGFQPVPAVKALASAPGISLEANLRDLRSSARRHAVAVLPLVSGAGIKNKLLEAAAMGLPVVCTPLATLGLRGAPPIVSATDAGEFASALVKVWSDAGGRPARSRAMREWVMREHSWRAAAEAAIAALGGHEARAGK